ncbi:unnamed protein product (macronuclear) [Paramecium tetraurelia]|uniref:Uncharacterized protein n=1 Tax=Paramecium tetraurelia TaxID=5888 RepID=A0BCV5_PARTE|nr:uncharacterized protein GSPATT00004466001 [Paramecium tetraurelia]CAK56372.1 unnamed protein product [Paramecium tetraurelia]|eukprot:XP_001423770.1 hypothetical protein (macronuclear) [Paramecium tetraurelia strain d4-2]
MQIANDEYIIPNLLQGIDIRNHEISTLSQTLDRLHFIKGLHEEDNLRLRAIITDMQYNFEALVAQKNIEISRLSGRVKYLEHELYQMNRLGQDKFQNSNKVEAEPPKLRELEKAMKQKDQQIQDITNQLQQLMTQFANRNQDSGSEIKKISKDSKELNLPFLVENDNLKKLNAELNRQVKNMNDEINTLKSELNEANAELARRERKLREYLLIDKMRAERDEEVKQNLQPVYVKVSEDKNLLDGVLALMHYMRESITDIIFEIFVRSANQAFNRKQSSAILFSINTKELKNRNVRGFLIVLYLYRKMKKFIKIYFPYYGKLILNDHMARIALGEDEYHLSERRDGTNLWLEECLAKLSIQKRKSDKNNEEDAEYQHLFRLLSLRYRCKYPLKGNEEMRVDLDIRVRLENKICNSLLKLFID